MTSFLNIKSKMSKILLNAGLLACGLIGFACVMVSCINEENKNNDPVGRRASLIFSTGEKVANDNFTGTVYLNSLIEGDTINPNGVGNVTFEPGARSKWHSHPAGQILLATDGVGFYQEKGQLKRILRKGDVIRCPPNILHWHGASADTAFVQLAITGREKGPTVWLDAVSDNEYSQ